MKQNFSLCLIFNLLFVFVNAQNTNIGILPVRNYEKGEYKSGTQNWDIEQDKNGVVYFANNSGLLQFDGTYWAVFPISNKTNVRSVCIAEDGKIYVGAQGEFGYFYPRKNGTLEYHSLTYLVPEKHKGFTDIWDIEITEDGVFFKAGEAIFKLFGNILDTYVFDDNIIFLGKKDEKIFVQIGNESIWHYHNGDFQFFQQIEALKSPITSILQSGDNAYFTTLNHGIFHFNNNKWVRYKTSFDPFFFDSFVQYSACTLPNGKIAIGSPPNGLLIFDSEWNLEYKSDKQKGLQNNTVLSLESDKHGNLWLGLDNGIDYLEANSPITKIFPDKDFEGTGYTAQIHNNHLYLGTNNGLYFKKWAKHENPIDNNDFQLISSTEGQTWGLHAVNNKLFLGHHLGGFLIEENRARPLENGIGTWIFTPLNDSQILIGQYNGISLLEKNNGEWRYSQKLTGLEESSRILIREKNNTFWMAHPYRGIFKVSPNIKNGKAIFQFYDSQKGLPSNQFNHVFNIRNKAIFTGEYGIFEFDRDKDEFKPNKPLAAYFKENTRIKTLREDDFGNIWFAADDEVGVLKIDDKGLERSIEKMVFPELSQKLVENFEYIYPFDKEHVFFAAEKGFLLLNPEKYAEIDTSIQVIISEVLLFPFDSLIYANSNLNTQRSLQLEKTANNLLFKFSSPIFKTEKRVLYQTKLEGLDQNWLPWTNKTEREINNLSPGDFVFKVRAKNGFNVKSEIKTFNFSIAPPWYATRAVKMLLGFSFLGVLFSLLYFQKNRFENQKAALEFVHQKKEAEHNQVVLATKEKINKLETQNLEAKIKHNNKELALATMHLVQKNKMILRIQRELKKIIHNSNLNTATKSELRKLNNLLTQDQILDEEWNQFEIHFDQVHSNFLQKLRDKYPQLSSNDFRLCAYLRMNLATKEIAPLLNISVRGVEASRYRLRKKLNLPNDQNLNDFMMNI